MAVPISDPTAQQNSVQQKRKRKKSPKPRILLEPRTSERPCKSIVPTPPAVRTTQLTKGPYVLRGTSFMNRSLTTRDAPGSVLAGTGDAPASSLGPRGAGGLRVPPAQFLVFRYFYSIISSCRDSARGHYLCNATSRDLCLRPHIESRALLPRRGGQSPTNKTPDIPRF